MPVEFQTVETRCGREGHTWPRGHSENPRCSCQQTSRQLETRCGREDHTRPRGPSESPDGVDPNIRRTRHNVTVITVGSKYEVYVQSPASSHMLTFRTLAIKWEMNIIVKKSSCVFLPSFLRLYHAFSFLRLYRCVAVDDYITLVYLVVTSVLLQRIQSPPGLRLSMRIGDTHLRK